MELRKDSMDRANPILFCWGSEQIGRNRFINQYVDSIVSDMDSTKELVITGISQVKEYASETGFFLADARASNIQRLFNERDSTLHILVGTEILDTVSFIFDSCYVAHRIEIRSHASKLNDQNKIIH
ncbi:MAG: hypothetical protein ABI851_08530 [Saprospiraceae bacterium]